MPLLPPHVLRQTGNGISWRILFHQEAVFVDFRLDFTGELLQVLPQGGDEFRVTGIIAAGIHLAFGVRALKVQADVI